MEFQDLSRPMDGERNVLTLKHGIRFAKIISKKFVCPKCNTFCGELIPIVDKKVRDWMRLNKKDLNSEELQAKVFCYAGCHNKESWGWKNFSWSTKDMDAIKSWPDEWKNDSGAIEKEKIAREQQIRIKRGL